jgi:hypothetical protein
MNSALNLLFAQLPDQGQAPPDLGPAGAIIGVIYLGVIVLSIAGMWKVFTKAGQPGWAVLIPFYNMYVLLKIVGRPGWWLILFFIPIVGLIVAVIVYYELSKSFGKGAGFFLGMFFLPFIFIPILGFGDSRYQPLKRDAATAY